MDTLMFVGICIGIFFSGLSFGALIENKRMAFWRLYGRVEALENTTQEILLPLGNKITHIDARHRTPSEVNNGTWTDYELSDPDATQELPKIIQD